LNAEETKHIKLFLDKEEDPFLKHHYWIGLTDQLRANEYVWASSGEVAQYTNWVPGSPDGVQCENYDQDCVYLKPKLGRAWDIHSCFVQEAAALCQRV
jgi:hypothetical protein